MFNEGDKIVNIKTGDHGMFLEEYAGVAYLEMDNGVEMDCSVNSIVLEEDYKTPEEIKQEEMTLASEANHAIAELIFPEVRSLLVTMAKHMAEKAALSIIVLGGSATPWDEMDAYHKMNFISVATGTSFKDWMSAYNKNGLDILQLSIFTAIGESFKEKTS